MNSLRQLIEYDESDSEEEKNLEERLPLPVFLKNSSNLKTSTQEVNEDGKIRNFPHEPGNWATYIHIPVDSTELSSYIKALLNYSNPLGLKLTDDFHVSLTKTVILRHHWISEFISDLKIRLAEIRTFKIHMFGLKVYTNEEKTRSFLSLGVEEGEFHLNSIVNQLKICFRNYNLHGFYENPSFHVSLFWCPGDKSNELNKFIDSLPSKIKNFDLYQKVTHCICTTGNKHFTFNFSP